MNPFFGEWLIFKSIYFPRMACNEYVIFWGNLCVFFRMILILYSTSMCFVSCTCKISVYLANWRYSTETINTLIKRFWPEKIDGKNKWWKNKKREKNRTIERMNTYQIRKLQTWYSFHHIFCRFISRACFITCQYSIRIRPK